MEILVGGSVVSSVQMQLGTNSYFAFIEYTGLSPSSVSFRFAGSSGDPGDSINFTSAAINNTPLNVATDLTPSTLTQGNSSTVTLPDPDTFGHTPPTLGTPTITGTGGDDIDPLNGTSTADVIDALAGNDYITARGGDDEINGGDGDDYIFGEAGQDTILGGAGNDVLFGNGDDDALFGEADEDYLIGGGGSDLLNGGDGDDGLIGDDGDDILFGEDGNDYLVGDTGEDILFGGDGNDFIYGGADDDALSGGNGIDQLIGGSGNDMMSGGAGNDEIIGEDGNDEISGDDGDDDIYGGDGQDTIFGGNNNDHISGGAGNDIINGGNGIDSILGGAGADTLDGGDGNDLIHAHGLDATTISDILLNNPNVVYSEDTGSFYQFVTSGLTWTASQTAAAATTLNGINGHLATVTTITELNFLDSQVNPMNDTSIGSYYTSGNDLGTTGEWIITDGQEIGLQFWDGQSAGNAVNNFEDLWTPGQPNDVAQNYVYLLSYSDGLADSTNTGFAHSEGYVIEWEAGLFSDDNAADIIDGGAGNDWLYGYGGDDIINGGDDNDNIFAGSGNDKVNGDNGDDVIMANTGADTVIGGAGSDFIDGGDGNDILHGHGLSRNDIQAILDANPDVVYNEATGSFYQYINTALTDVNAITAANSTLLSGVAGHIVNITSDAENDFVDSIASAETWIGASDSNIEGQWRWDNGAEAGAVFYEGNLGGTIVGGFYENFANNEPNDYQTGEDYLTLRTNGQWNDYGGPQFSTGTRRYVVEWEAGLFNEDNATDTINAGTGEDALYGWGGDDVLSGGDDNDLLFGGTGNDILNGDNGVDVLIGGDGGDTLNGGDGDDVLSGGTGNDNINGDAGTDTVDYTSSTSGVTIDLNTGSATGDGADTLTSIENVKGTAQADTITGDGNNNVLEGFDGDDEIRANLQTEIAINAGNLVSYGGGQDGGGTRTFLDDSVGVNLNGNNWEQILGTYVITANTILEFDFRATIEAEISGIGFDTDNGISSDRTFELYGTQNWGFQTFNNYDGSGDWTHYEIDVGNFYTGTFSRLFFVNDDDGNSPNNGTNGNSWFRNIIIHEGNTDDNTINGGEGSDDLYGGADVDTFAFDNINDLDTINFFNEDEDIFDISNILTGFGGGSDINDFVQFTNSGDHVTLSVDENGASGGSSFTDIAEVRGAADFDADALFTNGQIIV